MINGDAPDKFDFDDFNVVVDTSLPDHLTEIIPAEAPSAEIAATDFSADVSVETETASESGHHDISQSIEAFIADEERRK